MSDELVLIETRGRVGVLTLNRPKVLNVLNSALLENIDQGLARFDEDPQIGAIVITGGAKAFAAGADVAEMQGKTFPAIFVEDFFAICDRIAARRKPKIAAVAGYALGGGCELAMLCDFVIAADTARFGQPEIKLGVMPGIGGTQRLAKAVGKAKAMDLCLTGRTMDAAEAERSGLVARIVPAEQLIDEAIAAASTIAAMSLPVAMMTCETIERAFETSLTEGVRFERRMFQALFATDDQKEGMSAFLQKRRPSFTHR